MRVVEVLEDRDPLLQERVPSHRYREEILQWMVLRQIVGGLNNLKSTVYNLA